MRSVSPINPAKTKQRSRPQNSKIMTMIAEPRVRWRGPLSPLIHLANNWISLLGVVIVTTATVFWLFLLPTTIKGEAASPYIGILSYMGLPSVFFIGLFLIPVGI